MELHSLVWLSNRERILTLCEMQFRGKEEIHSQWWTVKVWLMASWFTVFLRTSCKHHTEDLLWFSVYEYQSIININTSFSHQCRRLNSRDVQAHCCLLEGPEPRRVVSCYINDSSRWDTRTIQLLSPWAHMEQATPALQIQGQLRLRPPYHITTLLITLIVGSSTGLMFYMAGLM